ncbi:acetylcholinesterase-1-like [Brevipalpus obovatus]|uniref:acetylcholinesterase-1-like n=1 Tax=Brevipalpus obovatus TaxID=246614 RepID=UPI003D9F5138
MMLFFQSILCLGILFLSMAPWAIGSDVKMTPIIHTLSGPIVGMVTNMGGSNLNVFYGIPYAKPPIDDLRLQRPQPMDKWTDVVEATELPPVCLQPRLSLRQVRQPMSEDCLYLNIITPGDALMSKGKRYPVMISILHAGHTYVSDNDEINLKSELVKRENIILVTMNARLNFFGYAKTAEEDGLEGNLGLMDENYAIRWINNNIEFFGGDKKAITIRGQGSGAANVRAHVLSPYARNLFQNAIAEDQDVLIQGEDRLARNIESANIVLDRIGCSSPKNRLKCIQDVDANDIISALPRRFVAFSIIYDKNYFTITATNEEVAALANDVNVLYGFSSDYSSRYLAITVPRVYAKAYFNYEDALEALEYFVQSNKVKKIAQTFIGDPSKPYTIKKLQDGLVQFLNQLVPCILYYSAYQTSDSGNLKKGVYTYEFNHVPQSNDYPLCDIDRELGVCTRDQQPFLFGEPYSNYWTYSDEDRRMSDIMMNVYGSFIKTGKPQLPSGKEWPNWNDPRSKDPNVATVILDSKNGGIIDRYNPQFCLDNIDFVNSSLIPKFHPYDRYDMEIQRKVDRKSDYTGFLYNTIQSLYFFENRTPIIKLIKLLFFTNFASMDGHLLHSIWIWFLIFFTFVIGFSVECFRVDKWNSLINKFCSDKSLMLKHGIQKEVAYEAMEKEITKLANEMLRGFSQDQLIDVRKKAQVGFHGQSISSSIIGTQQAVIMSEKPIIVDQTNNNHEDSEIFELKLSSRPTLGTKRREKDMKKSSIKNTDDLTCERQTRKEILRKLFDLPTIRNRMYSPGDVYSYLSRNQLNNRAGISSSENPEDFHLKEETKVGSYGYSIDSDQIASGSSQNTISNAILDQQNHSNHKKSKVSSIIVTIGSNIGA